jgi:hypothetical protein
VAVRPRIRGTKITELISNRFHETISNALDMDPSSVPLYRFAYFSIIDPKLEDDLGSARVIARQAILENPPNDIGGHLVYADHYFLQIIEGRRRVLSDLMGRIYADRRHVAVQLSLAAPVIKRAYVGMGATVVESADEQAIIRRFMGGSRFNPAELSVEALLALAQSFARHGAARGAPSGATLDQDRLRNG